MFHSLEKASLFFLRVVVVCFCFCTTLGGFGLGWFFVLGGFSVVVCLRGAVFFQTGHVEICGKECGTM